MVPKIGQPKVDNCGGIQEIRESQHQVLGLDVAMDDSFFVEMGDRLKERADDRDGLFFGKPLDVKGVWQLPTCKVVLD